MARYLTILARAVGVGAVIVIAAIGKYICAAPQWMPAPAQTGSLRQ